VKKFVIIGELHGVAASDCDVADREGAALLRDAVNTGGESGYGGEHQNGDANEAAGCRRERRPESAPAGIDAQLLRLAHRSSMRRTISGATRLFAAILLLGAPLAASAQEFSANGLLDLGVVVPSHEKTWIKGGFGKLDNGGGGAQGPAFVGQGLADLRLQLDPSIGVFARVRAAPDQHAPFDVIEAYGRYQPVSTRDWLWSVKFGAFFPPVSLENESVGWTSPWTLTPSAINSWVGDELRTIGGETNLVWRHGSGEVGLLGAVYGVNDPAGQLLADRGWVFDSRPSGLFGEPRVPDLLAGQQRLAPPLREQPFKAIGGGPGWYAGATLRENELGRLTGLYYDNRADPGAFAGADFGWRTKFTSAGLETYLGDVVVLAQAMAGKTTIEPFANFFSTTDFQAGYLLLGYYFDDFRVAGRVDLFATQLRNSRGKTGPGEVGRAFTVSGSWTPLPWLRLSTELIEVHSYRGQRGAAGFSPTADEVQVQFVTRLIF
jgi:hypothetical protein